MNNYHYHHSDIDWVEKVHQLLVEIARASLSDQPKLPENVAERALPLANKAKSIQEKADSLIIPSSVHFWLCHYGVLISCRISAHCEVEIPCVQSCIRIGYP